MNLNYEAVRQLKALAGTNPSNLEQYLSSALRLLAKWRSTLIANTIVARHGANILSGPFAGMKYLGSGYRGIARFTSLRDLRVRIAPCHR